MTYKSQFKKINCPLWLVLWSRLTNITKLSRFCCTITRNMYLGYYTICMHTIFFSQKVSNSDFWLCRMAHISSVRWIWTECGLKPDPFIRAPELTAGRPDRAAHIMNTFRSLSTHACFSFLCHYLKRKPPKAQKSCFYPYSILMCSLIHQKENLSTYRFKCKCIFIYT